MSAVSKLIKALVDRGMDAAEAAVESRALVPK